MLVARDEPTTFHRIKNNDSWRFVFQVDPLDLRSEVADKFASLLVIKLANALETKKGILVII